jgi:hypothetical protein
MDRMLLMTPEEQLDIFAALQVVLENNRVVASFGSREFDSTIERLIILKHKVDSAPEVPDSL